MSKQTVENFLKLNYPTMYTIDDIVAATGQTEAKVQQDVGKLLESGKITVADSSVENQFRWVG